MIPLSLIACGAESRKIHITNHTCVASDGLFTYYDHTTCYISPVLNVCVCVTLHIFRSFICTWVWLYWLTLVYHIIKSSFNMAINYALAKINKDNLHLK